jgi:hypothetical protein
MSNQCIDCGGEMFGDGYTDVERCENIDDEEQYRYNAPDEGPVYCGFEQFTETELKTGLKTVLSISCATHDELKAKIANLDKTDFYRAMARYEYSQRGIHEQPAQSTEVRFR